MNKTLWVVVVAEAVLVWFLIGHRKPAVIFRERATPEPRSIARVRELDHFNNLESCDFETPHVAGESTSLKAISGGFAVSLPGRWQVTNMDTAKAPFHRPVITYTSERNARVSIAHNASSGGRSFMADPKTTEPLPARYCESVVDSAGIIWSSYPPDVRIPGPLGRGRSIAFGDGVTSKGRRYRIDIGSWSEGERDSLAAIISAAVVSR